MMTDTPDANQGCLEATCSCGGAFYSTEQPDEDEYAEFDQWRTEHEDCAEPVNLDPDPELPPEIARWQELTDREVDVYHDGDAEKVIPFPRPVWADPDEDFIGTTVPNSAYVSPTAKVAATWSHGEVQGTQIEHASLGVQVQMHGDGTTCVQLKVRRVIATDKSWRALGVSLTPAEALEAIEVLHAAVDLIGGPQ